MRTETREPLTPEPAAPDGSVPSQHSVLILQLLLEAMVTEDADPTTPEGMQRALEDAALRAEPAHHSTFKTPSSENLRIFADWLTARVPASRG